MATKTGNVRGFFQRKGMQSGALNKAARRRSTPAHVGQVASGAVDFCIFRAPEGGAKIQSVSVNFGSSAMRHHANEADTWVLNLVNKSRGVDLLKQNASLSGVTIAASGFKELSDINNGNATMEAGAGLFLELAISGTPQTMNHLSVHTNWYPAFEE
jgi:hypothetical protein